MPFPQGNISLVTTNFHEILVNGQDDGGVVQSHTYGDFQSPLAPTKTLTYSPK